MDKFLRSLIMLSSSEEDEDGEDDQEEDSSLISGSTSYFECSPGNSDVFLQESAFGSFTSYDSNVTCPAAPTFMSCKQASSPSIKSRSSQRSTSSDSSTSRIKPGTMTKLFRRSVSLIIRSRSGLELSNLESYEFNSPLKQMKDSLLHIYRTNTLPHQGLCRFHEMLAELESNGEGDCIERWWKEQVVPEGTRILAVMVACPKKGDQIEALLNAWHLLYRKTLPLLQAVMVTLNTINVRRDVLEAFRNNVLPYSGIRTALKTVPGMPKERRWRVLQMVLILARIGPCQCHLNSREGKRTPEVKVDFTTGVSSQLETVPELTIHNSNHTDVGPTLSSPWNAPRINELVFLLMDDKGHEKTRISSPMLEEILHLHHRTRERSRNNSVRVSNLQRHEKLPSPGQWLTRNPTSVHSLEELLRSAASR